MDVFLVPVGADRYELYCEVPEEPHAPLEAPSGGFFRRTYHRVFGGIRHRFTEMLAEAERERRQGRIERPHDGWWVRLRGRMMRWVAESIAEQRLLWTLRRKTEAAYFYPADIDEPQAVQVLRRQLGRDFDKHQFWLIIDTLGFIFSGLLVLVPGPNLLAYYFAFRMVGHFFSLRGAKKGLNTVEWTNAASVPLADLRRVMTLDPHERDEQVDAIAATLGLEHFARFFKRSAIPTP